MCLANVNTAVVMVLYVMKLTARVDVRVDIDQCVMDRKLDSYIITSNQSRAKKTIQETS